jgi:hypothetical protein
MGPKIISGLDLKRALLCKENDPFRMIGCL